MTFAFFAKTLSSRPVSRILSVPGAPVLLRPVGPHPVRDQEFGGLAAHALILPRVPPSRAADAHGGYHHRTDANREQRCRNTYG